MSDVAIVCPFCNSRLERRSPTCPRCDARLPDELTANLPDVAVAESPPPANFAPGKRKTIAAILGIMLTMAALTTGFVLWTKDFRRDNDHKKGFVAVNPATQSPEDMTVVNLLPARCTIVGAVNLADVRGNPLIKKALLEKPPRSVGFLIDQLKDAGLSLDNLDQVAVGLDVAEVPPKIYVIAQTRGPYDENAVVKAFAPHKVTSLRNRPLVQYPLPQIGHGVAWCLGERHVAFVFRLEPNAADLAAIPDRPRTKLEGSSKKLQSLIRDQATLDQQSTLWLAADLEKKDGLDALLVFADTRPYKEFLDARALTLSVKGQEDLVVLARILANSAKSAGVIEAKLNEMDARGEKSKKVFVAPPEAEPWVTMQLRYEPAAIAEILGKGPGFKK